MKTFGCIILFVLGILFLGNLSSSDATESAATYVTPTEIPTVYYEDTISSVPYNPAPALEFNGYECTEDCSGHEAGYAWAEENDISYTEDCDGNSDSFIEGCMSYVEEYYPEEYSDEYGEEEAYWY